MVDIRTCGLSVEHLHKWNFFEANVFKGKNDTKRRQQQWQQRQRIENRILVMLI